MNYKIIDLDLMKHKKKQKQLLKKVNEVKMGNKTAEQRSSR